MKLIPHIQLLFLAILGSHLLPLSVSAQVFDPEEHIKQKGRANLQAGKNGDPHIISFSDKISTSRIAQLERDITEMPKKASTLKACDSLSVDLRTMFKAGQGGAYDVATTNYGYYEGSSTTFACVHKFIYDHKIITGITYLKGYYKGEELFIYRVFFIE